MRKTTAMPGSGETAAAPRKLPLHRRAVSRWRLLLGLLLAAVLLWWGGSAFIGYQVQQQLRQWLALHGMPSAVQWQRVQATPMGQVVVQGLRVEHEGMVFRAERLRLHGVRYVGMPSRIRLVVEGLSRQDGRSPLAGWQGPWSWGQTGEALPPLTLEADIVMSGASGRPKRLEEWDGMDVDLHIRQPQAFDLQATLHAQHLRNVLGVLHTVDWPRVLASSEERDRMLNSAALWLLLGQVTLDGMAWTLQDQGMVARWQGSGVQRLADCRTAQPWLHTVADGAAACRLWQAFVQGQQPSLHWQARPERPVALLLLWQAYPQQPARLAALLHARLSGP